MANTCSTTKKICGLPGDVNSNLIYLEFFTQFSLRVSFSPALSQRIILIFLFVVFVLFKKGVTFSVKYYSAFMKKYHFCFVPESCMIIQLLEPP